MLPDWLNPAYLFNKEFAFAKGVWAFFTSDAFRHGYITILFIFSLFFLTIICYSVVRMFEIRKKEEHHLHHEIMEYAHKHAEREKKKREIENISKNERWIKTLNFLSTGNPNDWRLAVIEADSMLDSLMTDMGFKGETLGDKLKSATQDKFRGLTAAWEVHTIRNRIAHEGSAYELSLREAKRIIAVYEDIFRGYGYI
jgi:hypothetical protein